MLGRFQTKDTWDGDVNLPITYNKWVYANSNPILFTDSSGYCPGPKDETDSCWQLLLQIESQYSFIDLQTELSKNNYWTYEELLNINSGLELYSRTAGLELTVLYPNDVRIQRVRNDIQNRDGTITCGRTQRITWLDWPIKMYNGFDSACFIHEMAHYLDSYNLHLSKPFAKYVGASSLFGYNTGKESPPVYGLGKPTSRYEDFAESLTEYVLLYTNHTGEDIGIVPGQKRWYFIESVLDTGKVPSGDEQSSCIPLYLVLGGFDYQSGVDL